MNKLQKFAPLLWLGLVFLLSLVLAGCNSESTAPSPSPTYEGSRLEGRASDFRLIDQQGVPVKLSDFRNKVVALAFLDPRCTDVCPLTALHFRQVHETLGDKASGVVFLAVNVNVDANTQAELAAATEKWGMQRVPNWHFLSGSPQELESVWNAYSVSAGGEVQHTPGVYLVDQSGNKRWYISIPLDTSSWVGPSLSEVLQKHTIELLRSAR